MKYAKSDYTFGTFDKGGIHGLDRQAEFLPGVFAVCFTTYSGINMQTRSRLNVARTGMIDKFA